jgi:hypothetical protein
VDAVLARKLSPEDERKQPTDLSVGRAGEQVKVPFGTTERFVTHQMEIDTLEVLLAFDS